MQEAGSGECGVRSANGTSDDGGAHGAGAVERGRYAVEAGGGSAEGNAAEASGASARMPHARPGAGDDASWAARWFHAFDTECLVRARGADDALMNDIVRMCAGYERAFSHTRPGSDVWRINHAGGHAVTVSPETAELIEAALEYCARSGGLFDITLAPVCALWNFRTAREPSTREVAQAMAHTGWRAVQLCDNVVRMRDAEHTLTLGGIAKGFIADRIRARLEAGGVRDALINLGGNIVALGGQEGADCWKVGIRSPRFHDETAERMRAAALTTAVSVHGADPRAVADAARRAERPAAVVRVRNESVVTSGVGERFFRGEDGRVRHHIVDPRTGYPAESDLASVTVITSSSLEGDGVSTALLIMGLEWAFAAVEETPGVEAVLIERSGAVHATSGARKRLVPGA